MPLQDFIICAISSLAFTNCSQSAGKLYVYRVNHGQVDLQSEELAFDFCSVIYFRCLSLSPDILERRGGTGGGMRTFSSSGSFPGDRDALHLPPSGGPSGPGISSNTACLSALR